MQTVVKFPLSILYTKLVVKGTPRHRPDRQAVKARPLGARIPQQQWRRPRRRSPQRWRPWLRSCRARELPRAPALQPSRRMRVLLPPQVRGATNACDRRSALNSVKLGVEYALRHLARHQLLCCVQQAIAQQPVPPCPLEPRPAPRRLRPALLPLTNRQLLSGGRRARAGGAVPPLPQRRGGVRHRRRPAGAAEVQAQPNRLRRL